MESSEECEESSHHAQNTWHLFDVNTASCRRELRKPRQRDGWMFLCNAFALCAFFLSPPLNSDVRFYDLTNTPDTMNVFIGSEYLSVNSSYFDGSVLMVHQSSNCTSWVNCLEWPK